MIDSSLWTGRDTHERLRFGFRSKNQVPLFMVWREFWNEDETDVVHAVADIVIDLDRIEWFGRVWQIPQRPTNAYRAPSRNVLEILRNLYWHWSYNIGWRQFCDRQMSKCRVCTSSQEVMVFDPRGLWAYPFRTTVCPTHCEDHDYEYEPGIGKCCVHCGATPPDDYYDDDYIAGLYD